MRDPYTKIIRLLQKNKITYEFSEHEPVYTSKQAARIRGEPLSIGAKSLLIKAGNDFVLVVLSGDKRLDSKKLKAFLNAKSIRFATPEEVKEVMGCEVGACYPIGTIVDVRTIVDNFLTKNTVFSFNPGVHNKTFKMRWKDYRAIVNPEIADIAV